MKRSLWIVRFPALAAALLLLATAPLLSQNTASKRAKIEELFTLIHMERSLNQLVDQQAEQLRRAIPRMLPKAAFQPEEQQDVDAFIQRAVGIAHDSLDWSRVQPQYVDLYATTYTDEEVDGLLAFYKSPVGQAMVQKQPELINRSQAIAQLRLSEMQPKVRNALAEFVSQMQAKYPSPATSSRR